MSKSDKLYKIFMTTMIVAIAVMLLASGIIAVQKSMKLKVGVSITPSMLCKITDSDDNVLFCNTTKNNQTLYVTEGASISGNMLTLNKSFSNLGGEFALKIYNYTTVETSGNVIKVTASGTGVETTSMWLPSYSSGMPVAGEINVTAVAGQVTLQFEEVAKPSFTVTYNLTGCTTNQTSGASVGYNDPYSATITTATGYAVADLIVSGVSNGGYSWNEATGVFTITDWTKVNGNITITCSNTPITYTVAYNKNGGSGTMSSVTHTYDTAKTLTANAFTRTGYTFSKWNIEADGSGTSYNNEESVKNLTSTKGATVTLYAQWTANTYTVVYNANNGSGTMSSVTHTYDTAKTLTANAFTRTGYTFSKWNTKADGSGTGYDNQASVKNLTSTKDGTVTLYAQWTPNANTPYTVNHYVMDTSGNYLSSATKTESKTGTTAASLTLANLKDSTLLVTNGITYDHGKVGGMTVETTTISADGSRVINLYYARSSYAVTLTKGTGISTVTGASTYYYGASVTINAQVTSGYTWVNWTGYKTTTTQNYTFTMPAQAVSYTANAADKTAPTVSITRTDYNTFSWESSDGVGVTGYKITTSSTTPTDGWSTDKTSGSYDATSATTYYVHVKDAAGNTNSANIAAYTLTIAAGTGTNLTVKGDGSSGTTLSSGAIVLSETTIYATASLKSGYESLVLKDGSTTKDTPYTTTMSAAKTISTSATESTYTITYTLNGGSVAPENPTSYTVTTATITLNNPTKTGYTFAGWTGSNGSTKQTSVSIAKGSTGNKSYTANWTPITYTVAYNANGGSGTMASMTHEYDLEDALEANTFTRTGYTFSKWNTKADGSGTSYNDKANVKNLTSTKGATVTLYAQWSAITYSVAYNKNGGSGTMSNSSHTYNSAKNLTANAYTREGYNFTGWNTKSDGSGTAYADKASVKNLSSTQGATVTLYAQWTAKTYTVTYNGNGSTSGAMSNSTYTYGVSQALRSNSFGCAKSTYNSAGTFLGWSEDPNATKATYTNGQSITISKDTTLYAVWDCVWKIKAYNQTNVTTGYNSNFAGYYYVEMGEYPQTYKSDDAIKVYSTEAKTSDITTSTTTSGTIGYGSDGYRYYFQNRMPKYTSSGDSSEYYTDYISGWYKFEPIKWLIIGAGSSMSGTYGTGATVKVSGEVPSGDLMLISELALYATQFDHTNYPGDNFTGNNRYYTGTSATTSDIYYSINGGFGSRDGNYGNAPDAAHIKTNYFAKLSGLDSYYTTYINQTTIAKTTYYSDGSTKNQADGTKHYIFPMGGYSGDSYYVSNYLDSDGTPDTKNDAMRQAYSSDFAKATGVYKSTSSSTLNYSYWWPRSGYYYSAGSAYTVNDNGKAYIDTVRYGNRGVRPSFILNLA